MYKLHSSIDLINHLGYHFFTGCKRAADDHKAADGWLRIHWGKTPRPLINLILIVDSDHATAFLTRAHLTNLESSGRK